MKRLIKFFAAAVLVIAVSGVTKAQTRQEKKAAAQAEVKKIVGNQHFYFVADYALPMTGGTKTLTSIYDLKITRDSIVAFLPYYGQAYVSPDPTDIEGGIKFTSTDFSYVQKDAKKGGWRITIKPNDHNITNWRDVQQMVLDISPNGYASLDIVSSHRDPISFQGKVVSRE